MKFKNKKMLFSRLKSHYFLITAGFISVIALTVSVGFAQQTANNAANFCTNEMAYQTVGKWGRQKKDDLAMADRTFPKDQFKPVLAKAQKVVELFMKANPEFKGIEANAQRSIRGDSYTPNGALPFRLDVGYGGFICVPNTTYKVEDRGKIILYGGYGYTTVMFNGLRDVLESLRPFSTTDGEEIYEFKKRLGEFKGFPMMQPSIRDEDTHEAIIIAPENRLPFKPVSREQFLRARIKSHGNDALFAADDAALKMIISNMSPAERALPAIIRDINASPQRSKLFATEAEGGSHLVTIDKSFFNPKLPRDAIQFMTVHWSWNEKNVPKAEAIRQFKQKFDFAALRQMLGN